MKALVEEKKKVKLDVRDEHGSTISYLKHFKPVKTDIQYDFAYFQNNKKGFKEAFKEAMIAKLKGKKIN